MRCTNCKTKFIPKYFNQKFCLETDECIKAFSTFAKAAQSKKNAKESRDKTKAMKEGLLTITHYKKILQTPINHIIRLIDEGVPCIATGAIIGKRNAGHYISRGSNDTIRFHLDNIFIQSEHSNSFKGGDTIRFQDGLKQMYGIGYFEYVETLRTIKPIKLSISQIKEKNIIAKNIVKELKAANMIYDAERRMELRNYYNNELGIY
jgi:hypothetical protein